LKFPGSAANANCALRTLRMLHKAEEAPGAEIVRAALDYHPPTSETAA